MIQGLQTLAKVRIASSQAKHAAEIGCRLKHGGGLMLLIGWKARFAAAMLFLFIISTTLVFHAFRSVYPKVAQEQMIQFLKNLAMIGGMLYIVVHGPAR